MAPVCREGPERIRAARCGDRSRPVAGRLTWAPMPPEPAADPLVPLLNLPDVAAAMEEAREEVDRALRHRALRRSGGPLAAEVGLRSARASAALEGHDHELEAVRAGTVTHPVVQGALRVSAALDPLADRWSRSPRQVLARLHMLAARDLVPDDALGRPVPGEAVATRLDALCDLLVTPSRVPVLLRAAVVHGELLALGAFAGPNGVVARAAARLTLLAGGLDPRGLIAPELGHLARSPEYQGSANAFATGTPDGLRSWLRHCASAAALAAADLGSLADATAS